MRIINTHCMSCAGPLCSEQEKNRGECRECKRKRLVAAPLSASGNDFAGELLNHDFAADMDLSPDSDHEKLFKRKVASSPSPTQLDKLHKHRCMRCMEEFDCRNIGDCVAKYDVLPSIISKHAGRVSVVEHCPVQPDWNWIRARIDRARAQGHIESAKVAAQQALQEAKEWVKVTPDDKSENLTIPDDTLTKISTLIHLARTYISERKHPYKPALEYLDEALSMLPSPPEENRDE